MPSRRGNRSRHSRRFGGRDRTPPHCLRQPCRRRWRAVLPAGSTRRRSVPDADVRQSFSFGLPLSLRNRGIGFSGSRRFPLPWDQEPAQTPASPGAGSAPSSLSKITVSDFAFCVNALPHPAHKKAGGVLPAENVSCDRQFALGWSAAYSLLTCCFFSRFQGDLLHSTASGASDFPHTAVQKNRKAL